MELFLKENNKKWGYVNSMDEIIIPLIYNWISEFSEGIAIYEKDELFGFIDNYGNIITDNIYQNAEKFSNGIAMVRKVGNYGYRSYGYINVKGIYFDYITVLTSRVLLVRQNNKRGLMKNNGEFITPMIYDYEYGYSDNIIIFKKEKKIGFVDYDGNEIIPFIYDNATFLLKGYFGVAIKKDKWFKWAIIDKNNNLVTEFIYDELEYYNDELIKARKFDKWGLIDKQGKHKSLFVYNEIGDISEGLASVKQCSGIKDVFEPMLLEEFIRKGLGVKNLICKYGYIDNNANEMIPLIYDRAEKFMKGLAIVSFNNKYGIINMVGDWMLQPLYEKIIMCDFSQAICNEENDNTVFFKTTIAKVKNSRGWGLINKEFKIIVECKYEEIGKCIRKNSRVGVKINNEWQEIDCNEVLFEKFSNQMPNNEELPF